MAGGDSKIPIWIEYLNSGWSAKTDGKTDVKLHLYAVTSDGNGYGKSYRGIVLAESAEKAREMYDSRFPGERVSAVMEMPYVAGLVARVHLTSEK